MSQENVEIVRRGIEAAQDEGRIDEWVATFDPDVEWDISAYPLPDFPDRGRGREALISNLVSYFSGWNDYESCIGEVVDSGEDVVVILHERARMGPSDVTLERDIAQVWTVREGACSCLRVFKTRDHALKAVELEE